MSLRGKIPVCHAGQSSCNSNFEVYRFMYIPYLYRTLGRGMYHPCLWILDSYPLHPPICYVKPSNDMMIGGGPKKTDADGKIHCPYLQEWKPDPALTSGICDTLDLSLGGAVVQWIGTGPALRTSVRDPGRNVLKFCSRILGH
ncbi:hypothetical protein Z043_105687 [Scleropages formosus]|uniref:UEV domain-containing protein n=1 Tax=Scleropages formosus TaxID=113540 RepID=A0A0P7XFV9_SCLFO|nr:hypothetical protein Z043_105687 [Scleropages formosus]